MTDRQSSLDLAIIGGGPAGLTAAIYAGRARISTTIFDAKSFGGNIVEADLIENYPGFPDGVSGAELSKLFIKQAESSGAKLHPLTPISLISRQENGLFSLKTDTKEIFTKSVILSTGTNPRKLEIPGEAEYAGRGVSWCATCDAPLFRDKTIAVIGGGNSALEESLFLTKFASKVYLIHRREEFRADQILKSRVKNNPKITTRFSTYPTEILGFEGRVSGIRLKSATSHTEEDLSLDGIFIFIGSSPASNLAAELIKTDKEGFILSGAAGETSVPGLFVAGDVSSAPVKQITTAVGQGAIAAQSALNYLDSLKNK